LCQGVSSSPGCHSLILLALMILLALEMAFRCSFFMVFRAWGSVSPSCCRVVSVSWRMVPVVPRVMGWYRGERKLSWKYLSQFCLHTRMGFGGKARAQQGPRGDDVAQRRLVTYEHWFGLEGDKVGKPPLPEYFKCSLP
jgi:hypothetical protein